MPSEGKEILRRMIIRIDGDKSERFDQYKKLAREGIGGFIIFGGEVEDIRNLIDELLSIRGFVISSDLESGAGSQLRGGTRFPSQMAIGMAYMNDPSCIELIRDMYRIMRDEILYIGINTVYAPVLDLDTNPENPIISIRSYGTDAVVAGRLGKVMVEVFNERGIKLCAKHFIGHGDTSIDSHHDLPFFEGSVERILTQEMVPFMEVIREGISSIMMAHVVVKSIDPVMPASISKKVVSFLKDTGFHGVIFTDALSMSALKDYGEVMASKFAIEAGVDFLLHPSDASVIGEGLSDMRIDNSSIERFIDSLKNIHVITERPDLSSSIKLSKEIHKRAITMHGEAMSIHDPFLIIVDDESKGERGGILIRHLKMEKRAIRINSMDDMRNIPSNSDLVVSVHLTPSAFKKDRRKELKEIIHCLQDTARLFISMGDPHIFHGIKGTILYAYDDTPLAEEVVAEFLLENRIIRDYSI